MNKRVYTRVSGVHYRSGLPPAFVVTGLERPSSDLCPIIITTASTQSNMAFLCPSRRSRQKKKKREPVNEPFLGRITGSASVDTLVRVGLEKQHGLTPESRMTVIDDFSAAVDDELSVSQGQLVYMLYTEQEWMYVISDDGKEGFIPRSFATPLRSPASHRRPPPTALSQVASKPGLLITMTSTDDEGNDGDESNSPTNSSSQAVGFTEDDLHQGPADHDTEKAVGDEQQDLALDLPDIQPFEKREVGNWVALFPFEGQQEDDVRLSKGEVVVVLNKEDADWLWVRRSSGQEGFAPRSFLCHLPDDLRISGVSGVRYSRPRGASGHSRTKSLSGHPLMTTGHPQLPPHHRPLSSAGPLLSTAPPSGISSPPHAPQAGSSSISSPPPYSSGRRPHSSMGAPFGTSSPFSAPGPPPFMPSGRSQSSNGPLLSKLPSSSGVTSPASYTQTHRPQSSTGPLLSTFPPSSVVTGPPLYSPSHRPQSSTGPLLSKFPPSSVVSSPPSYTPSHRPHSSTGSLLQTAPSSPSSQPPSSGQHQRPWSANSRPFLSLESAVMSPATSTPSGYLRSHSDPPNTQPVTQSNHGRLSSAELKNTKINSYPSSGLPNGLKTSNHSGDQHDVRELITLHRFSSKAADDISVSSGEIVYSDLAKQPEKDWLWVYSPKLEKHGYIPRNNVKFPGNADRYISGGVARV